MRNVVSAILVAASLAFASASSAAEVSAKPRLSATVKKTKIASMWETARVDGWTIHGYLSRTAMGSKVRLTNNINGADYGLHNLTGPMFGIGLTRLFQREWLAFGVALETECGLVETTPTIGAFNPTLRRNCVGVIGPQIGIVAGNLHFYVQAMGGGSWESLSDPVLGKHNAIASAWRAAFGIDWHFDDNWLASVKLSGSRYGDYEVHPLYIEPKDDVSVKIGVGYKF